MQISFNEVSTYGNVGHSNHTDKDKSPNFPSQKIKLLVFGASDEEKSVIKNKFCFFEILFYQDLSLENIFSMCSLYPSAKVLLSWPGEKHLSSLISYFTATRIPFATYKSVFDIAAMQVHERFF